MQKMQKSQKGKNAKNAKNAKKQNCKKAKKAKKAKLQKTEEYPPLNQTYDGMLVLTQMFPDKYIRDKIADIDACNRLRDGDIFIGGRNLQQTKQKLCDEGVYDRIQDMLYPEVRHCNEIPYCPDLMKEAKRLLAPLSIFGKVAVDDALTECLAIMLNQVRFEIKEMRRKANRPTGLPKRTGWYDDPYDAVRTFSAEENRAQMKYKVRIVENPFYFPPSFEPSLDNPSGSPIMSCYHNSKFSCGCVAHVVSFGTIFTPVIFMTSNMNPYKWKDIDRHVYVVDHDFEGFYSPKKIRDYKYYEV